MSNIVCFGFKCDSDDYDMGNKCCNDCEHKKDCKDNCQASKEYCGQTSLDFVR